ncbi:MAG TPA: GNAT family N-acetyltransferase [Polyangiaceae bacterium]|nr:GNAT family N-acetyltransferase [Polyangiaceae bacterium]
MSNDLILRRAAKADLPTVGEFAGRLVRDHHEADPARFFLPERVEQGYAWWLGQELENPKALVMVAELSGELVGYSYSEVSERDWNLFIDAHATLHDILVAPEVRRRGVGRELLAATLRELEARGVTRILLYAREGNEKAERLFASVGFRRTMIEMMRATP